jgi:hypothetical protein
LQQVDAIGIWWTVDVLNSIKKLATGGKRPGAERPRNSTQIKLRELLEKKSKKDKTDYVGEFLDFLLDNYKADARLMIWDANVLQ